MAQRFLEVAQPEGLKATASACEVSRALVGPRLGLPPAAVAALDDVWERWDGLGMPGARSGEQLSLVAQIVHLAEQVARVFAGGGRAAAITEVGRRAGGHLDPQLAAAFAATPTPCSRRWTRPTYSLPSSPPNPGPPRLLARTN